MLSDSLTCQEVGAIWMNFSKPISYIADERLAQQATLISQKNIEKASSEKEKQIGKGIKFEVNLIFSLFII